jgi:hypothetical protein
MLSAPSRHAASEALVARFHASLCGISRKLVYPQIAMGGLAFAPPWIRKRSIHPQLRRAGHPAGAAGADHLLSLALVQFVWQGTLVALLLCA